MSNADEIVAISNQTKQDLVETFKIDEDIIKVVYQSCNEVFYDKRTEAEQQEVKEKWSLPNQFLLYVGALNENKNVIIILEALNSLRGKINLPLVVVGQGAEYKKKMIEFARKENLLDDLIFASEIANPSPLELSSFYQLASAFIFPSFYEGFGIPILEARFSGTPVIASNSSCLEEAGGEESYYFNPEDAEELVDRLQQALELEPRITEGLNELRIDHSIKSMMEIYTNY